MSYVNDVLDHACIDVHLSGHMQMYVSTGLMLFTVYACMCTMSGHRYTHGLYNHMCTVWTRVHACQETFLQCMHLYVLSSRIGADCI